MFAPLPCYYFTFYKNIALTKHVCFFRVYYRLSFLKKKMSGVTVASAPEVRASSMFCYCSHETENYGIQYHTGLPDFVKIGGLVQKLKWETHRQRDDPISRLFLFKSGKSATRFAMNSPQGRITHNVKLGPP
jgi:hypothetical protein